MLLIFIDNESMKNSFLYIPVFIKGEIKLGQSHFIYAKKKISLDLGTRSCSNLGRRMGQNIIYGRKGFRKSCSERSKSYWNDFLNINTITRRRARG